MIGTLVFQLGFVFVAASSHGKLVEQPGDVPRLVEAPVKEVYVPAGFDNNDMAQFVIEGEFPNTCYSIGPVTVRKDIENKRIFFYQEAYHTKTTCLMVRTRYVKPVDVGILPAGDYKIFNIRRANDPLATLKIKATDNPDTDDFVYAPVDTLMVRFNEQGIRKLVTLSGNFTSTCMRFRAGKMPIYHTSEHVIELLPIVEWMEADDCKDAIVPFSRTVEMPATIPTNKYLFHVRTMNGSSFNKVDYLRMEVDP